MSQPAAILPSEPGPSEPGPCEPGPCEPGPPAAGSQGTGAAGPAAPAGAPVPLRRNHGFRMLWIGQLLSDTGSQAGIIAYPLLILALTRSPAIAGVVGTITATVQLTLGLPVGALVDRLDRRRTMIACDSVRAVVLAVLGTLVLLHEVSWPLVLAVAIIERAGAVFFDPAANAALPAIVADQQLEEAWAATEARTFAASLSGPALGGVLFAVGRAVPFLGDAVSYLVSAGSVRRIRGQFRPARSAERTSLLRETADGIALVWRTPLLRAVIVQAPLINFAFAGVLFTITLALRRHGTAPAVIGVVQAGIMAGGLAGALIAPRLQGRLKLSQVVLALAASSTVLFSLAAVLLPSVLVAAPVALALLLSPTGNAALFAAMLRVAPEGMRGRVNNTVILAATALAALAPLTSGLLVQQVSGRVAMVVFTGAIGIAALLSLVLPGLRDAERAMTTAPPVS
jgi:MFS family permease